jgi:hypothetical protein
MEPRREEPRREERKAPTPRPEEKPKRFRLIKLEERIAPGGGGSNGAKCTVGCGTANTCGACDGTGGGLSIE